ncbi:hypothetical protein EMCRGX_G023783 [Ephydatia muelleri]
MPEILLPFLQQPGVASLGNFTVSSQVFFYTDVKFQASQSGNQSFSVLTTQLPVMISSVESKLGSQVTQLPSINFLVYLPRRTERPLYIVDPGDAKSPRESFLVPQWGGVVIYNARPDSASGTSPASSVKMGRVMPIFIEQLTALLGIPTKVPTIKDVEFSPNDSSRVTDWQLDLLLTAKIVEGVSMATSSLISLVELLDKVKNMVISDHIRDEVVSSVEDIQQCHRNLKEGNMSSAYWNARSAVLSSEAAFFDPSILALLYFPDDQKYAIYIPLFLPISIPILLSSLTALKWIIRSLKPDKWCPVIKEIHQQFVLNMRIPLQHVCYMQPIVLEEGPPTSCLPLPFYTPVHILLQLEATTLPNLMHSNSPIDTVSTINQYSARGKCFKQLNAKIPESIQYFPLGLSR